MTWNVPAQIDQGLLSLPPLNGTATTFKQHIENMLAFVEQLYGPRDKNYTFAEILVHNARPEATWVGNATFVKVSSGNATSMGRVLVDVSHEIFHAYHPKGSSPTNNLEEGLAADFSVRCTIEFGFPNRFDDPKYERVMNLVRRIFGSDAALAGNVKALLTKQIAFGDMTSGDIRSVCQISIQDADDLAGLFY